MSIKREEEERETQVVQDGHEHHHKPKDPYNILGFGFTAYFGMLKVLFWLFFFFSVLMVPVMWIY